MFLSAPRVSYYFFSLLGLPGAVIGSAGIGVLEPRGKLFHPKYWFELFHLGSVTGLSKYVLSQYVCFGKTYLPIKISLEITRT